MLMEELSKLESAQMTKLSYVRKGRHPRRNNGGVSPGKKEKQEERLFGEAESTELYPNDMKTYENGNKSKIFFNLK